MSATIHIAGLKVRIGPRIRQRCAWCGSVLADYDLTRTAAPEGQAPRPPTWALGGLVAREGDASWEVRHVEGDPLPEGACRDLEPGGDHDAL